MIFYALLLQGNNYYIGQTDDMDKRWHQHATGCGAAWTRLHPPIAIVETRNDSRESFGEEDRMTKQYMQQHGLESVCGGSYCQVHLDDDTIKFLRREIRSVEGGCFRCGLSGHVIGDCVLRSPVKDARGNPAAFCARCGCPGHQHADCYAHSHITGRRLSRTDEHDLCYRCGRAGHFADECYARTNACGRRLSISDDDDACYRCGRLGHYAHECYAHTHASGQMLR